LTTRLNQYKPGDTITVLIGRRDRTMTVSLTLASLTASAWQLEPRPNATPDQVAHLRTWLGL